MGESPFLERTQVPVDARLHLTEARLKQIGLATLRQQQEGGWEELGVCDQYDQSLFYPENYNKSTTKEAKAICAECIVRTECLEDALLNDEPWGVRGGLNPRERRKLKKQQVA